MGFKKGQSGNPQGRRPGTGVSTRLREAISSDLDEILQVVVDEAKIGNISAAKLLIERCYPTIKPMQQTVTVEGLDRGTLSEQGNTIIEAMGKGEVSPDVAQAMLSSLANQARIIEFDELEQRIALLEEAKNESP